MYVCMYVCYVYTCLYVHIIQFAEACAWQQSGAGPVPARVRRANALLACIKECRIYFDEENWASEPRSWTGTKSEGRAHLLWATLCLLFVACCVLNEVFGVLSVLCCVLFHVCCKWCDVYCEWCVEWFLFCAVSCVLCIVYCVLCVHSVLLIVCGWVVCFVWCVLGCFLCAVCRVLCVLCCVFCPRSPPYSLFSLDVRCSPVLGAQTVCRSPTLWLSVHGRVTAPTMQATTVPGCPVTRQSYGFPCVVI